MIDSWVTVAVFLIGVALGIVATALYVQAARRRLAEIAPVLVDGDGRAGNG